MNTPKRWQTSINRFLFPLRRDFFYLHHMILRIILIAFSWLLLAAHFSRANNNIIAIICLIIPFILLIKRKWALNMLIILTVLGALEWVRTTWQLIHTRIESGDDWKRMAIILFSVAVFTIFTAFTLNSSRIRKKYNS